METRVKYFCGGSATEAQEKHIAETAIMSPKKQRYLNRCHDVGGDSDGRDECEPTKCGNEDFYKLTVTVERISREELPGW